jgi:hypothetical protein
MLGLSLLYMKVSKFPTPFGLLCSNIQYYENTSSNHIKIKKNPNVKQYGFLFGKILHCNEFLKFISNKYLKKYAKSLGKNMKFLNKKIQK